MASKALPSAPTLFSLCHFAPSMEITSCVQPFCRCSATAPGSQTADAADDLGRWVTSTSSRRLKEPWLRPSHSKGGIHPNGSARLATPSNATGLVGYFFQGLPPLSAVCLPVGGQRGRTRSAGSSCNGSI
ncbi:hypothetical protein GGR56DRAFT_679084 [Xylariaceae sp. FL0804]|nr:hypothetical protein GGR56DRAFT_679084 [Xylariaceae sp. FL0804]